MKNKTFVISPHTLIDLLKSDYPLSFYGMPKDAKCVGWWTDNIGRLKINIESEEFDDCIPDCEPEWLKFIVVSGKKKKAKLATGAGSDAKTKEG